MADLSTMGTGLKFQSAQDIIESEQAELEQTDLESQEAMEAQDEAFRRSLAGHIVSEYDINRSAKESSGIKDEIIDSLRSFNGEYSDRDKQLIEAEGGSSIFMNITATKSRAAKSWIADVMKPARGKAWSIKPTPLPELPSDITDQIKEGVDKEFGEMAGGDAKPTEEAQETIRVINQRRRDIQSSFMEEIQKEAQFQMEIMEREIEDQMVEGKWGDSLSSFIDDFCIYPTAFLKGPVVHKENKLKWEQGKPVVTVDTTFKNERVDPLDIYPSPSAKGINDGTLIEHMRLSRSEISSLRGNIEAGYHDEAINRVLMNSSQPCGGGFWYDGSVETEKADQERRGNEHEANRGIFHAMHFFGSIQADVLKSWEFECAGFDPESDDYDMVEVEAILVGNEVIKCVVNDDPLFRRPYYKASFMSRPGSFWGRSLPNLMNDIQRLCNATARALANNLGIASGPQVEVYIDRLASNDEEIEEMRPRQVWQLKSDPAGNSGRAMNWFQPTSNAAELLAVYKAFEERADDVTGIPRYAYGNEKVSGAGTTLGGLSMLLESASKIIKDAIRNIDEGLVKPRIEQQFYINLLKNPREFSGDITVTPIGSSILAVKAFEDMRRNEFLALTANQFDQETMGKKGRASVLRQVADNIGLADNPVPSEYELGIQEKRAAQAAQQAREVELSEAQKDRDASIQATSTQIEGQERMSNVAQQVKVGELQRRKDRDFQDGQLKVLEITKSDEALNKELAFKTISPDGKGI